MMRMVVVLAVVAMVAGSGCAIDPAVSDTGYVGTWERGNPRIRSTLAIAKVGDGYKLRWGKRSTDGRLKAICDWDGTCEEWFDGKKSAAYTFRIWEDRASGHLFVEAVERRTEPEPFEQRYTDELTVTDGGKVLWSYTVERNGEIFESGKGPRRSFDKAGDGIAYPPRPASRS